MNAEHLAHLLSTFRIKLQASSVRLTDLDNDSCLLKHQKLLHLCWKALLLAGMYSNLKAAVLGLLQRSDDHC